MKLTVSLCTLVFVSVSSASQARVLNWQDFFASCDRIYKGQLKSDLGRYKVSVFSELPASYRRHQSKDGVEFFTASENPIEHRGMKLIAIYGVADCSEGSVAEKEGNCVTSRPPQITMVWQSTSKPTRFDAELRDRSQSWYDPEMPSTFWSYLASAKAKLSAPQKLYETECQWLFRPRAG